MMGNPHGDGKSHHAALGHYPHIQDTMSLWAWSGGDRGRTILFQILHWIGLYLELLIHLQVWRAHGELCKHYLIRQAKWKWKQSTLPLKQTNIFIFDTYSIRRIV